MKLTSTKAQELQYIRALVYGDSGIGKTTSLKTLNPEKTLIAAGERGLIPLRSLNFNVLPFESWDDLRMICKYFMAPDKLEKETGSDAEDQRIREGVKAAKVLAIDSLSEVSDLCAREIINVDRRQLVAERTRGERDTPFGFYADQLTLEDYGLYRARMTKVVIALSHLPVHVICTAHAGWTKDKSGGERQCWPDFPGKFARECPRYFGIALHMEAAKDSEGKDLRLWRTFNDNEIYAKDESGVLDPFEKTDWTNLFKKILKTEATK